MIKNQNLNLYIVIVSSNRKPQGRNTTLNSVAITNSETAIRFLPPFTHDHTQKKRGNSLNPIIKQKDKCTPCQEILICGELRKFVSSLYPVVQPEVPDEKDDVTNQELRLEISCSLA